MTESSEEVKMNYECEEGSFIYSLHEKDYFDENLFWKLSKDLVYGWRIQLFWKSNYG